MYVKTSHIGCSFFMRVYFFKKINLKLIPDLILDKL